MRAACAAAVLFAVALPVGTASAATVSDTASVTVTLDAAGTLPLDQFNPTLGTLTRVQVSVTTNALVQVCIENTSPQAVAVGGGTSEGSLDAAFPGSVARAIASAEATGAPTTLAASDGTADCSAGFDTTAGRFAAPVIATDATFFQQTHVATNSATLTSSGQMSPYIGTGSVAVGYTPLNDTELVFPAEWQSTAVAQGQLQATVTYTYTPTGRQIPGTGSDTDRTVTIAGAIVLTGVAATLVARRRRSARLAAGGQL